MSEPIRTVWLSDVIDIIDKPETNRIICHGKEFALMKHGYWIAHAMSIKDVPTEACSECGEWSYGCNEPYCPKCGVKMDEQET